MTQLQTEVAFVETMIERLISRRTRLRGRMNALSPISQLSPEILVKIFQMTCYSAEDSTQHITPLFFGGICKDWRENAWSTPLLWNTVTITVWRRTHATQISLLDEWLLRAQSSPLSIKLTVDEHESNKTNLAFCCFRPVMELLITRAEYWQTFDCILPHRCHGILQNHKFPLLTSISLRPPTIGWISTLINSPSIPGPLSAPKLAHVNLSGYSASSMGLPWGQLRSVKIQILTIEEFFALLLRSQELKECYVEAICSPRSPEFLPPQMLFHDLETLDVLLTSIDPISILNHLNLPKLRVLSLRGGGVFANILIDTISTFVLRSSCHLERLSVEQLSRTTDDDILTWLETTPSLTHLRIKFNLYSTQPHPSIGFSDKLVSRLRPSQQGLPYLLPRLTSLEYRGPVPCNTRLLVDVLSERWHHVSHSDSAKHGSVSLRPMKVEIDASPLPVIDIPDDVRDDIVMLVSEGMELEIRTPLPFHEGYGNAEVFESW